MREVVLRRSLPPLLSGQNKTQEVLMMKTVLPVFILKIGYLPDIESRFEGQVVAGSANEHHAASQ